MKAGRWSLPHESLCMFHCVEVAKSGVVMVRSNAELGCPRIGDIRVGSPELCIMRLLLSIQC